MPRRKDTKFTTFNDGSLDICSVKGRKIVETRQAGIRFGFRTVGIKRFYEAKVLSNQIDEVVAILPVEDISTMDICIIRETGSRGKGSERDGEADSCGITFHITGRRYR